MIVPIMELQLLVGPGGPVMASADSFELLAEKEKLEKDNPQANLRVEMFSDWLEQDRAEQFGAGRMTAAAEEEIASGDVETPRVVSADDKT